MSWREFPWQQQEPDPNRDRLCTRSCRLTHLDCSIEGANFIREQAAPKDEIVLCAYNAQMGLRLDDQLRAFGGDAGMPSPDILLLSEADRGCTRSGNRNVAREYARALGLCYVYGVEFIELPRSIGPGGGIRGCCEHGNAIASRFPLGNVRLIRHNRARRRHSKPQRVLRVGEPRLGGRVALAADVLIGERKLRVYSVHFDSLRIGERVLRLLSVQFDRGNRRRGSRWSDAYHEAQARELMDDASGLRSGVVMGGDMNIASFPRELGKNGSLVPATRALVEAGYPDAHAALPASERVTQKYGVVCDLIFGRGVRFTAAGVGKRAIWRGLSDHLPVWASVAFVVTGRD
jgi:endonuclease/exonuclease/phosphatase family metal-dependent hydrolase